MFEQFANPQFDISEDYRIIDQVLENVPCFKTLQNQILQISEETIKAVNDRIMAEARRLKLTKGKKMRVDSTVTEANIHY
ncbi:MAG: hypothetical protein U9Q85_03055, partial [Patescibacteria group bacterium]|nr:hypothetical protein [Patescibacteria group bacterium]